MNSENLLGNLDELPLIIVKDGIVIKVNHKLIDLIEFSFEELVNNKIEDIFKKLKVGPDIDIENVDQGIDYFLFGKSLKVKFVNIKLVDINGEKIYIFYEKNNQDLNTEFPLANILCKEGYYGVGIYSAKDMTLLKGNQKFVSFFDEPFNKMENCIGKPISEFVTGFKGSDFEKILQDVGETGKSYNVEEYEYKGLNRGITYWRLSIIPICKNRIVTYYCIMTTEITEQVLHRKKIEEQAKVIEKQKKELEAVLDNMADGFAIVDKHGNYTKINKTVRRWNENISHKKVGDTLGRVKYYDLSGKELTKEELPAAKMLRGEKVERFEFFMKSASSQQYFSVNATPIYDKNDEFILGTINTRDITERINQINLINQQKQQLEVIIDTQKALKDTQERLLIAEREKTETLEKSLEMKDEFLSLISHEFRTPLNVISTATQAMNLMCGHELSDKAKKYLHMIRQNTFRQLRLVNNLLDITRVNAGRAKLDKKNIDIVFLTKSIAESVSTYALQKGINVEFISSIDNMIVATDDEKYERVLLNLLSNAIKFSPEGKCINISLLREKDRVCIKVKDEGIGIPSDKIDLIFEKFGQVDSSLSRQAEGTGIGLSLVKKFTEALGGSITVESKVGVGSTFTISLPIEILNHEENPSKKEIESLMDNHLVAVTNVEFSDIYF